VNSSELQPTISGPGGRNYFTGRLAHLLANLVASGGPLAIISMITNWVIKTLKQSQSATPTELLTCNVRLALLINKHALSMQGLFFLHDNTGEADIRFVDKLCINQLMLTVVVRTGRLLDLGVCRL
jgi:hypothetical protein